MPFPICQELSVPTEHRRRQVCIRGTGVDSAPLVTEKIKGNGGSKDPFYTGDFEYSLVFKNCKHLNRVEQQGKTVSRARQLCNWKLPNDFQFSETWVRRLRIRFKIINSLERSVPPITLTSEGAFGIAKRLLIWLFLSI